MRSYGMWSVIAHLGDYLVWRYRRRREQRFDKKFNVDTLQGDTNYFDSAISGNSDFGVPYEPVQYHVFKEMLGKLPLDFGRYTFLDLGSGKGRALLFATNYNFEEIIGVEFSEELHAISERNIENYLGRTSRPRNVVSKCLDVVDYTLPETDLVIFLYNPFFGNVMDAVIKKIEGFLSDNRFDLVILYRNPQCADLFDKQERLVRVAATQSYRIYRKRGRQETTLPGRRGA